MVAITQTTKQPYSYLLLLWVATIAVVIFASLGAIGQIQLNHQWQVNCISILFVFGCLHATFRTVFPIEHKTVVTSDAVELTNSFDPMAHRIISKDDVRYFFRWRKVWYRPRAWIYHVRYLGYDDRIGLIGMRYISPFDTPEFFDAVRTIWGEAYVRDQLLKLLK